MDWYPQNEKELADLIDSYLGNKSKDNKNQEINGIIVPHAGYEFSGKIAGKAYSLLENMKSKTAIILAPSHYKELTGFATHNESFWKTPLGKIKIKDNDFKKLNLSEEHAIDNQIPFLQKLGFTEILPIMIGEINKIEAEQIANQLIDYLDNSVLIISTDLSHFLTYKEAVKKDKETLTAIKNLNSKKLMSLENSACGIYPLLILIEICKIKGWKPQLIQYKNSGDITNDKSRVVGYSSFIF
jgi:AmmeMemoRadiSam system protein B